MRSKKINGYVGEIRSSFLSCEKDLEKIINKLFVESNPYSDDLKRLLVINNKDCLRDKTNPNYISTINKYNVSKLFEEGYINTSLNIELGENEKVKSYIIISFDSFVPNSSNPYYRDCTLMIDILCNKKCWNLDNFQIRPIKIAGIIDGILNNEKFSGIGTLQFQSASELVISENLGGYCLTYSSTHGNDDNIEEVDLND